MKVAVAFALVAACIAVSYSAPAPQAVDWTAVGAKVGEIEALIRSTVQQIKEIATKDNAQVGSAIGSKLDEAAVKALAVLEQAKTAISNQSLTEAQAKVLLTQLKDILAALQQAVQDDLSRLSAAAAGQIRDLFYAAYANTEQKAQELYALLSAFAPQAVDWTAVSAKVGEIEGLIRGTVQQIKEIATKDNAQVGSAIGSKLDEAAVKALAVLEQAKTAISNQSLTEAQAKVLLTQLKDILAALQQAVQDDLSRLSAGAASNIRDLFYAAYANTEQKAQELYALLSAFAPQAVDWTAVSAKVGEIEGLIRGTVQQIKEIATKDNAQVGSAIGSKLDEAAVKALAVLEQAKTAISNQSLTEAQAKVLLNQLKDILAALQQAVQDDLSRLSAGAASNIRDLFYAAYANTEQKAQELYALLSAFAPQAVNWAAVGTKVGEIEALIRSTVQQIKEIANKDNAQVGSAIGSKLDASAVKATAVLERAKTAISNQSLTEAQAKALLTELKDILAELQQDVQTELSQLSAAAASNIRDLFYAAYANTEQKAQELYALLRQ